MKNLDLSKKIVSLVLLSLLLSLTIAKSSIPTEISSSVANPPSIELGALALSFVPNYGQSESSVLYQVRGLSGDLYFKQENLVFSLPNTQDDGFSAVQLDFLGRNPDSQVAALDNLPGKVNYLRGDDAALWLTNIPSYSGVMYRNLYTGIDLRYFGMEGRLKSEFTVAVGANPQQIRWAYLGANGVSVDAQTGDLLIELASGDVLREKAPLGWQDIRGERIFVDLAFHVAAEQSVSFTIGDYSADYELILDPVIEYSSYLGGSSSDSARAIAADNDGNAYVVGFTESANFPTTVGALSTSRQGANDAFVMKIDTDASGAASLLWSTYFGGAAAENATGVDVDAAGNIYITGTTGSKETDSPPFPITGNAYQSTFGACCVGRIFLTKLDPTGTNILYSTYFHKGDPFGLSVDSSGVAYITGTTSYLDFPTTANAYQQTGDATNSSQIFVSKIDTNASGSAALLYSTYIYGNDVDVATAIAADEAGNVYITGKTESTNFPVTASAYQSALKVIGNGDGTDAFVLRLDTTLSGTASLLYSTYFGGQFSSTGLAGADNFNGAGEIATDGFGNAYITGETNSADLPIVNGYQTSYRGDLMDAFVAKFDTDASGSASLLYSSYLGGNDYDKGYGIAVDTFGNVYVAGVSQSTNFPVLNGLSYTSGGFVTRINTNAAGTASLLSSTRLGGSDANGIGRSFVDANATVYTTGQVSGNTFPIVGGFQTSYAGNTDAYVVRLSYYSDLQVSRTETNSPVTINTSRNYSLTVTNLGNDTATNVTLTDTLGGTVTINSATATQGSCTPTGQVLNCSLGNIFKNASVTINVSFTPTDDGTVNKSALVDATEIDTNGANNSNNFATTVVNTADLAVTMSDAPDPVVASEELTYSLTVTNNGAYDATATTVTNVLPAGLNYVSSTASQGTGCTLVGTTLTCDLGTLTVSGSATLDIVLSPSIAGTLSNTVTVDSAEIDLVAGNNSATTSTTVLAPPPAAPSLLNPVNAGTVTTLQPVFSWNKPSGAVRFEIQMDTSMAFVNPATGLTATSFTASPLLTTTYYWRVRAFNSGNVPSEWSNINSVTITSPANSAPLLNFDTSATPTLTWNSVSWANQYEIQVDNSSTFTLPLEYTTTVPATEFSITTTALTEGTHYWRVRALNGSSFGAWSATASFLIDLP